MGRQTIYSINTYVLCAILIATFFGPLRHCPVCNDTKQNEAKTGLPTSSAAPFFSFRRYLAACYKMYHRPGTLVTFCLVAEWSSP